MKNYIRSTIILLQTCHVFWDTVLHTGFEADVDCFVVDTNYDAYAFIILLSTERPSGNQTTIVKLYSERPYLFLLLHSSHFCIWHFHWFICTYTSRKRTVCNMFCSLQAEPWMCRHQCWMTSKPWLYSREWITTLSSLNKTKVQTHGCTFTKDDWWSFPWMSVINQIIIPSALVLIIKYLLCTAITCFVSISWCGSRILPIHRIPSEIKITQTQAQINATIIWNYVHNVTIQLLNKPSLTSVSVSLQVSVFQASRCPQFSSRYTFHYWIYWNYNLGFNPV